MPKTVPPAAINQASEYFRTAKSTGSKASVDREGGRFSAGLITRVSVITAGEALGHEAWIDETFISQVHDAMLEADAGVKSRFTHPDMSSDGMGKTTSRLFNPELSKDGRQLYADQHFLQSAHKAPDGDLAGYLMDLADEDPASYGLSIVFKRDSVAMDEFRLENSDEQGEFISPDSGNVNNYEHVRLHSLHAADAVDEPAANPNGLFHREQTIAGEAEAVAAFALGLSKQRPEVVRLGLNPDRVRGFAERFLSTHKLELREKSMSATAAPASDATPATPAATPAEATKPAEQTQTTPTATEANSQRVEAEKFMASFGEQGAIWFAQGLSFEQAQAKQIEALQASQAKQKEDSDARFAALEAKLAAGAKVDGATAPAGFAAGDDNKNARKGFASKLRFPGEPKPQA